MMAERRAQDKDLIFALDIGTRSVVGIVGKAEGDRLKVLAIELAEHKNRAMLDGQIDDIHKVADLARAVTGKLEERTGVHLERVCVAAAGRALRTLRGSYALEFPEERSIDAETISQLESGAVSNAEETLISEEEGVQHQFFLVGYTVAQYLLDNYPLSTLLDHTGKKLQAEVVATFLPGEVVESLYAAMGAAGLQVASITLEPIAAMNAAIPPDLRLLNLALVDIGAGTTDIAICKDGTVVGYTMATVAGDEITEAIMQGLLVDFQTAERMKRSLLLDEQTITYKDVLGLEETIQKDAVKALLEASMDRLADAIATQVKLINGSAPSALFLAGGGSKLDGLREKVAQKLEMADKRVAIAGNNFEKSAFSDEFDLENPEYTTPLGIAISAGLGLLNDSYVVLLNGEPAKLFRSGVLTVKDVLLMNGYTHADVVGKSGRSLNVSLDGRRMSFFGEPATPAVLTLNDEEATLSAVIHAGDRIQFIPARSGAAASKTVGELVGEDFSGQVLVNNQAATLSTVLEQGDVVLTWHRSAQEKTEGTEEIEEPEEEAQELVQTVSLPAQPVKEEPPKVIEKRVLAVTLNGEQCELEEKEDGQVHRVMDLLEHSGIDFESIDRPVTMRVNGKEAGFQQVIKNGDVVEIRSV